MSRGGKPGPRRKHLPHGTLVGASREVKLLWFQRDLEPEPEPLHLLAPLFDESTSAPPLTQDESGIVALAIELLAHERTDHAWMVVAILFDGDSPADIACRYDVTRSRVGQVRDKFLRRLRHAADKRGLSLPRAEDYRYTAATPPRHCYDVWTEAREKTRQREIEVEQMPIRHARRVAEHEKWRAAVVVAMQALQPESSSFARLFEPAPPPKIEPPRRRPPPWEWDGTVAVENVQPPGEPELTEAEQRELNRAQQAYLLAVAPYTEHRAALIQTAERPWQPWVGVEVGYCERKILALGQQFVTVSEAVKLRQLQPPVPPERTAPVRQPSKSSRRRDGMRVI